VVSTAVVSWGYRRQIRAKLRPRKRAKIQDLLERWRRVDREYDFVFGPGRDQRHSRSDIHDALQDFQNDLANFPFRLQKKGDMWKFSRELEKGIARGSPDSSEARSVLRLLAMALQGEWRISDSDIGKEE